MKKERNIIIKTLDFSKVILMLLIVLYHSTVFFSGNWFNQKPVNSSKFFCLFSQILNSFHVYAFVLISGYIYAYLKFEKNKYLNIKFFVKNKFKRLIIPYIFISLFWVIPFYFYFFNVEIKKILFEYFLGTSPSQLWFLLMLFNIFIIIFFIGKIVYFSYWKAFILSLVIYGFGLIGGKFFPNIYQIISSCNFLLYFIIGMLIYRNDLYILKTIHSYIYLLIFLVLWVLKLYICRYITNEIICKIYNLIFDFFIHIEGSIMTFIILGRIAERLKNLKYNYENFRLYNFLKKYNFIIYLLHQQIIYCVIDKLNGKVSPFILVSANFFISLFFSSIIILIFKKIKPVKWILNL